MRRGKEQLFHKIFILAGQGCYAAAAAALRAGAPSQVLTEPMIVLYAGAAQAAISANVSRAAAMVASITSSVCMIETKPASKTDGAK